MGFFDEPSKIRVYADRPQTYNGWGEVQGIFNANFNGEGGESALEEIQKLELNGARLFLNFMGGWIGYDKKWKKDKGIDEKAKLTDEQRHEMWGDWLKRDYSTSLSNSIARSRGGQDWTMRRVTDFGITNHIAFHMTIGSPVDTMKWPELSCNYLKHQTDAIIANNPALKGQDNWFFFECEPNYGHWSGRFKTTYDAVTAWIKQYDNLEAFAEKHIPDFKISGPCVASGGFFNREGYKQWGSRVVRDVKNPMKRFIYNEYYMGPMSHFSWFSMLQSEAEQVRGVRPRGYVAENNHCTWWTDHAGERSKWYIQQMFMLLENPDKWDGVSVHMGAFRGQCSDLLVPDKTNPRAWKWKRTELGEHFALCKDIRGKNLYVANHDARLRAFATLKDANTVVLAVYNPSTENLKFAPEFKLGAGKITGVTKRTIWAADTAKVEFGEAEEPELLKEYALRPDEMYIFTCRTDAPQKLGAEVTQRDFYAKGMYNKTIMKDHYTTVKGPEKNPAKYRAFLRMGVADPDQLDSRGFTVRFNGKAYKARWADAAWEPGVFLCYYLDIPLEGAAVKPENELSYENVEHSANILFTSLVVKEELEDVKPPKPDKIGFNLTPPGRIFYGDLRERTIKGGDTQTLTLILDNTAEKEATYNVQLDYTEGFEGPKSYKVKLGPDSRQLIDVPVKCVTTSAESREDKVTVRVTAKGREAVVRTTARLKSKAGDKKSIEEKEL